jgi:hypothetical protein
LQAVPGQAERQMATDKTVANCWLLVAGKKSATVYKKSAVSLIF